MATLPVEHERITEQFGPHRNYMSGVQLSASAEPDRLVKTAAVRDQAQSEGERGHRLRAVGRVPV